MTLTAEQIIARWTGLVTPMLDGILEDCAETERLDQLLEQSHVWLAANNHVHRYRRQDPNYSMFRVCHCGASIHPDEYTKLKSREK